MNTSPAPNLTTRPLWPADMRALIALSIPIVITNISRTGMSFVDFLMVSRLGTEAQAAIVPATVLLWSLIGFGLGVNTCVNTFASQALGRNKLEEASLYAWQGVWLSVLFGGIGTLLYPVIPAIFRGFGHPAGVIHQEVAYTQAALFSLGPSVAVVAASSFFTGIHRPRVAMFSMIIANLFNVVGDYVLIFGKWGFPQLGIAGAAWATVAATVLQTAVLLGFMVAPHFAREFHTLQAMRWNTDRAVNLLRYGAPSGVQWMMDILMWAFFLNWLVGRFGTVELAATNVVWKFSEIGWMPAVGIASAASVLVGKSIGKKDFDAAVRQSRVGLITVVGYMCTLSSLFLIFRTQLIGLISDDPDVVALGALVFIPLAIFQMFDSVTITYINILRGAGDILVPAVLVVGLGWIILLGGGRIMVEIRPEWGSIGPWILGVLFIMLLSSALTLRWRSGRWREIDIFAGVPDVAALEGATDVAIPKPPTIVAPDA
jgi:MATE family multidrug resistance protein